MNNLTLPQKTMSSVEIAELTGKRHDNVMRVARKLADKEIIRSPQIEETDCQNKKRMIYRLNKTESLNLVANLSPEFTARIIDRWQELEKQPAQLSRIEILQMALESEQKLLAANERIEALEPKAKALQRIATADGSLCIRDAAKTLQTRPKDLTQWLSEKQWIYKRPGVAYWIGYQHRIQQGLLEHKSTTVHRDDGTEKVVTQVRVTPKGLTKLSETFNKEAAA